MVEKIYTGTVKHLDLTLLTVTDDNLERLLANLYDWRQTNSNKYQDYDLYIKDQNNNIVFGSRF